MDLNHRPSIKGTELLLKATKAIIIMQVYALNGSRGFVTGEPRGTYRRLKDADVPPCPVPFSTTWGGWILTQHLNYVTVAGYTGPRLFLFERIQQL